MNAVGIDISKGKSTVTIRQPGDVILMPPRDIPHTQSESNALIEYIRGLDGETKVCMEHTGKYYEPVATWLSDAGRRRRGHMDTRPDWIIHCILDDPGPYPYLGNAHTHGMEKYKHLDFQTVINFPQEHICYLLNTMSMRVRNGETFHDGDMVSGIYEDCSIRLKKVREAGRDVLRLIIPDAHNRFPEDNGCMEPYRHQELEMFEN